MVLVHLSQDQQQSSVQLNHRRIVEAIRNARPADVYGRKQFVISVVDDPICEYVCQEIGFHIKSAWETDMEQDSLAMSGWLGDVPQDEIVRGLNLENQFCGSIVINSHAWKVGDRVED